MTDVFISYKKEDVARVEPIARALAQAGFDVWWDHRIPPGRTYRDVIGAALESTKCVIVVWSNLSANAQWVLDEADAGKKRNVLLPLLIDDVEIPYGFRQIEAARLVDWKNDPAHPEWRAVLDSVGHFVGRAPGGPPKSLAVSATQAVSPPPPPRRGSAPAAAPAEPKEKTSGATLLIAAVVLIGLASAGGYFAWKAGVFDGALTQAESEVAPDAAIMDVMNEVRVDGDEATIFRRQPDGAWVEFTPEGMPRFLFTHESDEGEAVVINDETRNVRLRMDPAAMEITEETAEGWRPRFTIAEIVRSPELGVSPESANPSEGVTRVWFEGGGAFVLDGENGWAEVGKDDGLTHPSARWREESRDEDTITLADDGRQAGARIELSENAIYLYFPDWGDWNKQWDIRAVERE